MDNCAGRSAVTDTAKCRRDTKTIYRLASRKLLFEQLPEGAACPTDAGRIFKTKDFTVVALGGDRQVQPGLAMSRPRQAATGRIVIDRGPNGWWGFKTLWFARPSYQGPFLVRGLRLDRAGEIRFGEGPHANMLAVRNQTMNGSQGFRQVPGGTHVKGPGCYGWQVDGVGFSYRIVFEAISGG